MNQIYFVTLAFLLSDGVPRGAQAAFVAFTTILGHSYLLSDTATTFSAASSDCVTRGSTMATYDNILFQDVVNFLSTNSPVYDGYQIWVPVTKTSGWPSQYFFSGGDEVAGDKWYTGEPDLNCASACCYRMALDALAGQHRLRDHYCTQTYYYICVDSSTTTISTITTFTSANTTETHSTTTETATTETSTLDTTTPAISTTAETLTTVASTTLETTTPATSTTADPLTTVASITLETTTPTTSTATSIKSPQLPLSTSEQMSILYLGVIVGGSLVISCCCSTAWLVIFRTHRRFKNKATDEEGLESRESDNEDSTDCSSDEEYA